MSHQDCHNHCDNDRKVKGNLKVCKKLKVKGDTTLEQNLDVKGNTTTDELKVLSDAEVCGDLDVKGTLNAEGGIIIEGCLEPIGKYTTSVDLETPCVEIPCDLNVNITSLNIIKEPVTFKLLKFYLPNKQDMKGNVPVSYTHLTLPTTPYV